MPQEKTQAEACALVLQMAPGEGDAGREQQLVRALKSARHALRAAGSDWERFCAYRAASDALRLAGHDV